jgi:hypothetical protein
MSSTAHVSLSRVLPLAAVLAAAVAGSSCYSGESALGVTEFQTLTITAATATTAPTCIPSGTAESAGVLDVARPGSPNCCGYAAGVELTNTLPMQQDMNTPPLSVDQHDITINSVTVSYQFTPDPGSPNVTLRSENLPVTAVLTSGGGTATFITPVLSASNGAVLSPAGGTPATGGVLARLLTMCTPEAPACTPDSWNQPDGAICP